MVLIFANKFVMMYDYLASNSYVEESFDEGDSVDGISDTDDEVTDIIEPVSIVHPTKGKFYEIKNRWINLSFDVNCI